MDWFRSWHNAPTDPKWLLIARRANVPPGMVSAVFWSLLDYASQEKDRGSVAGFDPETYAGWAGWEESDVLAILDAMRSKGVITSDDRLASWEKRQVKREDEGGAARVKAWRDAQRNATDTLQDDVTQSNAVLHDVTQSNPRLDSDKTRLDHHFGEAVAAWQGMGLLVNPTIKIEIEEAVDYWRGKGHPEFVADAIRIATKANVRRWDYVQGILKRCEANGTAPNTENKSNGTDPTKRTGVAPIKSPAEQAEADRRQAAYELEIAAQLAAAGMLPQ